MLEFPSVVDALRCAVDVQRGMAERNAGSAPNGRIDFRIVINVGDIIIDDDDIFGDDVNVAARLQTMAEPGGICVSRVARDQVLDKVSFTFDELGAQQIKNIARPVEVYRVDLGATRGASAIEVGGVGGGSNNPLGGCGRPPDLPALHLSGLQRGHCHIFESPRQCSPRRSYRSPFFHLLHRRTMLRHTVC